jgi:RNA recognition motif-containing protein
MEIYIGNLPENYTEKELSETFSQFGNVKLVKIIPDPNTGESSGYGFVEMGNPEEAQKAIDELDGQTIDGNTVFVNKSRKEKWK